MKSFTAAQLRKLCTGKPTPTPGYHPSHHCKNVYLISPTSGPVCHYACSPDELKNRMDWHKEAMGEWIAEPVKRAALEREIREGLHDSREAAIRAATVTHAAKFIENGNLFFVTRRTFSGGVSISQL